MLMSEYCKSSDEFIEMLESASIRERQLLLRSIENQFSIESAVVLFDEGELEIASGRLQTLVTAEVRDKHEIQMTNLALCDLNAFSRTRQAVINLLVEIPSRIHTQACYPLPERNGFVVKEQLLRVICRIEHDRVIVMAIANVRIDPLGKVWRYFTQAKGEDLIKTGELYFRRADLLSADPYECRLPVKVVEARKRALESVYPGKSGDFSDSFELTRQSTYICCWTMREHESYLAWKHYCRGGTGDDFTEGGFAVQSTQRRILHLHAGLRATHEVHCRQIGYLDHWNDDIPSHAIGEEAFWKANWFSDEREIRLAILRPHSWSNSPEWKKPEIPTGERVSIDLEVVVDSIVINPFASTADRERLDNCVKHYRSNLASRLRDSVILRKPPLETLL